jgi:predicted lipid-binding transport protein (Tim44 family)
MSNGFAYLDILFFAMVALVIAYRLRSVLGRRTGNERRRDGAFGEAEPQARREPPDRERGDNVVHLPERDKAEGRAEGMTSARDGDLKSGITQIRLSDRGFELDSFLQGARAAFEMIVEAFARGEKDTLRPLLADDVYRRFTRAIDDRTRDGHELDTNLVSVDRTEVVEAGMVGPVARLTVRFVSQQVNVTRDRDGRVVDGDPGQMHEVVDLWTFERDTRGSDPNWRLVQTRTE